MTDEERLDFIQENRFAQLSFLQHAILHRMQPGEDGELHVRLDGDFETILRLQSAERDLLEECARKEWAAGWDACTRAETNVKV